MNADVVLTTKKEQIHIWEEYCKELLSAIDREADPTVVSDIIWSVFTDFNTLTCLKFGFVLEVSIKLLY